MYPTVKLKVTLCKACQSYLGKSLPAEPSNAEWKGLESKHLIANYERNPTLSQHLDHLQKTDLTLKSSQVITRNKWIATKADPKWETWTKIKTIQKLLRLQAVPRCNKGTILGRKKKVWTN